MYLGLADHFGWAVAVTSDGGHDVVDRRRIELVEPGFSPAPIHYEGAGLEPRAVAALVADVRASVVRATTTSLDELAASLREPIRSISLRSLPSDFPADMATLLRPPWEARADAVMYRRVLAELAEVRGWSVHYYEARTAEREAADLLAGRADAVLRGPRARLGPPWTKDHRTALAATALASLADE